MNVKLASAQVLLEVSCAVFVFTTLLYIIQTINFKKNNYKTITCLCIIKFMETHMVLNYMTNSFLFSYIQTILSKVVYTHK